MSGVRSTAVNHTAQNEWSLQFVFTFFGPFRVDLRANGQVCESVDIQSSADGKNLVSGKFAEKDIGSCAGSFFDSL